MKITPETKIKDIIPEGYELDKGKADGITCDYVPIFIKPKTERDFMSYVGAYLDSLYSSNTRWVKKGLLDFYFDLFFEGNYDEIEYELRIGLLRFILLENGSHMGMLHLIIYNYENLEGGETWKHLIRTIPSDFFKSLK